MSRLLVTLGFCLFPAFIHAADLASLSNRDAIAGLRETLNKGAEAAIKNLGHEDGFLGNKKVRIPLPDSLKKAEKAMRLLGMQAKADELTTAMNRAAERQSSATAVGGLLQRSVRRYYRHNTVAGRVRFELTNG